MESITFKQKFRIVSGTHFRNYMPEYDSHALVFSKTGTPLIRYSEENHSVAVNSLVAIPLEESRNTYYDTKYIYHYLYTHPHVLENELHAQSTLSKKYIETIEIPWRDTEQRNEIVTILDKIKNITDVREFIITLFPDLSKAAFLDLFGDPVKDEDGFPYKQPLYQIADVLPGGNYKTQPIVCLDESEPALLTQTAITRQEFDPRQNKTFVRGQQPNQAHRVQKGDVLISRKNSYALLGTAAYVYNEVRNLVAPDTIFRITNISQGISGIYLTYLFNDSNFRKKLMNYSGGTLQTMPNITVKSLQQFTIPCPDPNVQKMFEETILTIRKMEGNMQQQLQQLRQLMTTMSQALFAGQEIQNIDLVLTSLLNNINPESDENNYTPFEKTALTNKLIAKITGEGDEETFPAIDIYNRAQKVLFHLLKKDIITQKYDSKTKTMNIRKK